jgi:predicted amino acid-binding ACT domain protein
MSTFSLYDSNLRISGAMYTIVPLKSSLSDLRIPYIDIFQTLAPPEITNLCIQISIKQDVLRFQVLVDHSSLVHSIQTFKNLLANSLNEFLAERVMSIEVLEERHSVYEFEYDVDDVSLFQPVDELDDVGPSDASVNVYFFSDDVIVVEVDLEQVDLFRPLLPF